MALNPTAAKTGTSYTKQGLMFLGLGAVLAPFTGGMSLAYGACHLACGAAYDTFGLGQGEKTEDQKAAEAQLEKANQAAYKKTREDIEVQAQKNEEIRKLEAQLAKLKNNWLPHMPTFALIVLAFLTIAGGMARLEAQPMTLEELETLEQEYQEYQDKIDELYPEGY